METGPEILQKTWHATVMKELKKLSISISNITIPLLLGRESEYCFRMKQKCEMRNE